ncbi:MAG: hypothetical protein FJ265_07270 [Planctomycetes bacterium]|nr:hypothetical protein [Planctomycetota bacterium]
MQELPGAAPSEKTPEAASEAAIVQAAVESFVELHGCGEAPSPDVFVQRYPEAVRPRLLAQIREFLAFDGLLGHQEWRPGPAHEPAGRAFGDFTIQEELGRGGMGIVYLAHQRSLNRRVALKVMASGLTLSKRHVERFRREAAAAAQVRHPAIVPVHSFTEVDGTFAFAMDFVAGRNLADLLDDLRLANGERPAAIEGRLGVAAPKGYVAECAVLAAQLASALAAAHQAGVVHRDLKPRNVMIDDRGQARLLDFGLAKSLGEGSISMSGEITGTAHYMSPEQTLAKRVPVDHRADVWALGVILYELLTLRRPFDGKNLQQVVYEICFKEPVPVQRLNPRVGRDLVTICHKALEKDPQNRYQTAAEFEQDLQRFLRWEPIHARPAGPFVRLGKWLHRHRTEAWLLGAAAAVAVIAVGYRWYDGLVTDRAAAALQQQAQQDAERGDYASAIRRATEARVLRDDPAIRRDVELYQQKALVAATRKQVEIAESRRLVLESARELSRDRELALLLALEAVRVRPAAESLSAVLAALGSGFRTVDLQVPGALLYAARWSPDGRFVATAGTAGEAGNVLLWDAGGTEKRALRGHQHVVIDVAFHPNGELLATAGIDRTVRLWRTADGTPAGVWPHEHGVSLVRFDRTGNRALTMCNSRSDARGIPTVTTMQVFDVATGARLGALTTDRRAMVAAALSPCGRYVACGPDPDLVLLWDAATGAELAQLHGEFARPRGAAFSPDGSLLAAVTIRGGAHVYAVPDGRLLGTVAHSQPIDALVFDGSGERLLSGGRDQTARLWRLSREAATGALELREVRTFVGHGKDVVDVGFDPAGQFAVTACADQVLRVFDASDSLTAKGVELMRYEVGSELFEATFDPAGRRILAKVSDQRALVWDFADARGVVTLRQRGAVRSAAFDPSGDRVVTAGDDEQARLWNGHDGRLLWETPKLGNPLLAVDVDPRGERFALGVRDGRVLVHSLADGRQLGEVGRHGKRVTAVRFCADGSRLLSVREDKEVPADSYAQAIVWNVGDQSQIAALRLGALLAAADLSPGGDLVALAVLGGQSVQLWSVADRQLRGELGGHAGALRCVRFRPDGKALLAGAADGTVRVYDLGGAELAVLRTGNPVLHASWSRDGARVLTNSARDTNVTRAWNVADGTELLRFRGHANTVEYNAFSPDGQWAMTTSKDGTTCIWPTDPVAAAARLQLRPFSPAERLAYDIPVSPGKK